MKFLYVLLAFTLLVVNGCNSVQSSQDMATGNSSSADASSENSIYLKATIDGQPWQAEKMIPDMDPNSSYKRIHGEKGETMISFQLWKPATGLKRQFGEDCAADFWSEDGIFGGRKGEVTVTKADDKFIEGTFYFVATTTNGTGSHEITNGSFRVAATPREKATEE